MATKPSLLPEKIDSPQMLLIALQKHDWWYEKSDDFSEWRRGSNDAQRIRDAIKVVPNGEAIYKHYCAIRSLIDFGHE